MRLTPLHLAPLLAVLRRPDCMRHSDEPLQREALRPGAYMCVQPFAAVRSARQWQRLEAVPKQYESLRLLPILYSSTRVGQSLRRQIRALFASAEENQNHCTHTHTRCTQTDLAATTTTMQLLKNRTTINVVLIIGFFFFFFCFGRLIRKSSIFFWRRSGQKFFIISVQVKRAMLSFCLSASLVR